MNEKLVLHYALENGTFDASDVMTAVDLTRATVLGVCADLVEVGWLEAVIDRPTDTAPRRGRPALRYRLRKDAGVVTGLDAGENHFTVCVADLRGRILAQLKQPVPGRGLDGEGRVTLARRMITTALASAASTAPTNLVTTVAVPAPVDDQGLSPIGSGRFWPIMNPGYATQLEGIVEVENDANLTALAEHARGHGDDVAILLADERLGTGLVVDGRLLKGNRGGAGEVRFLQAMVAPEDTAGQATTTGLSRMAIAWAREELENANDPSPLRDLAEVTAADVLHAAQMEDPVACRVADKLGERLALVAMVLGSVVDVQKIIVAGAIAPFMPPVLLRTQEVLAARFEPPFPDIVASSSGPDMVALGAVESALRRVRADPLSITPGRASSNPP